MDTVLTGDTYWAEAAGNSYWSGAISVLSDPIQQIPYTVDAINQAMDCLEEALKVYPGRV